MVLAYILICCVPLLLCVFVIFAIGKAALKTYRTARKAYGQVNPYVNDLQSRARRLLEKSTEFGERLEQLAAVYEEIGGRWTFISETLQETSKSPIVKVADIAGKFSSRHKDS